MYDSRALLIYILSLVTFVLFTSCEILSSSDDDKIDQEVRFTHELVTGDLEYPWQMAFTPDGRILVTEIKGDVHVIKNGLLESEPWFDLKNYMESEELVFPSATDGGRQRSGLQGIAVDPDFTNNGFIYLGFAYHTDEFEYDFNRLIKLREDPVSKNVEIVQILLDRVPGYDLHQAAQIKFGPDKKLYWATADRFEEESSQVLDDLSGKILRLNTDGSIPDDNPFSNSFVYSYGHRNPQGMGWQPESNLMMITEHGPSSNQGCCRDELNVVVPGGNYGWPLIAGDETGNGLIPPILHSGNEPENIENQRDSTWAPSGAAFIQTGPWKGSFLFAGLRSRTLFQLKFDQFNNVEKLIPLIDTNEAGYFRARSVDQAPNGDIYMITSNMDRKYNPNLGRTDYLVKINVFYVE